MEKSFVYVSESLGRVEEEGEGRGGSGKGGGRSWMWWRRLVTSVGGREVQ